MPTKDKHRRRRDSHDDVINSAHRELSELKAMFRAMFNEHDIAFELASEHLKEQKRKRDRSENPVERLALEISIYELITLMSDSTVEARARKDMQIPKDKPKSARKPKAPWRP